MAWCSLSCLSMSGAPGCRGLSSGAWHQVRFHGTDVDKQRPSRCNELLCLHGGVHVEPSCLCYRCVKIGTISWLRYSSSWVAVANCVTASYPRTPQKGVLASGVVLVSTVAAGFRSLFDKGHRPESSPSM
ncbi:hypothetical protein BKA60DRAFT_129382 [Fusarium oxysporum]|nr:hypothetical protein BKA60DRAFT_129382 [Fusarium oxysporum]